MGIFETMGRAVMMRLAIGVVAHKTAWARRRRIRVRNWLVALTPHVFAAIVLIGAVLWVAG